MPTVPQRHRWTDGQTDGRTTCDSNTALALRASRDNDSKHLYSAMCRERIRGSVRFK